MGVGFKWFFSQQPHHFQWVVLFWKLKTPPGAPTWFIIFFWSILCLTYNFHQTIKQRLLKRTMVTFFNTILQITADMSCQVSILIHPEQLHPFEKAIFFVYGEFPKKLEALFRNGILLDATQVGLLWGGDCAVQENNFLFPSLSSSSDQPFK